jgi:membrane protease YdiL (CAAX protease family)
MFLYVVVLVLYYGLGKVFTAKDGVLTNEFIFIATGIVSLIAIAVVFLFCYFRNQKFSTIGFDPTHAKISLKYGLILMICVTIIFCISAIMSGTSFRRDIYSVIMWLFYYLIYIAFVEELIFRGYIGTRLYGFFQNKLLGISITGLLFTFMHIPMQMLMSHMNFVEYVSNSWGNFIFIFLLHYIFQILYAKFNSILAPILFHFAWDYVQWLLF